MGARPSSFKADRPTIQQVAQGQIWSKQQEDIFRWFDKTAEWRGHPPYATEDLHLVVRARAGTGKTTTIIEGVNRAPEARILVCAFNKRIAEEMAGRITNDAAEAKTLHAVGYAAIRRQWPGMPVASGSVRADWLTTQVCGKETPYQIKRLVTMLHTKCREMVPLSPTLKQVEDIALFFDYVPDDGWGRYDLAYIVESASEVLLHAAHAEPTYDVGIDFADMIYLPLVRDLLSADYDLVVVDEAQDMTLAQLTIAQRLCGGRLCLVGDDRQAIYGFRGADSKSLDRLKAELQAGELPLVTTYRCAQAIVRRAQGLVPDIQAGVDNPEGRVTSCGFLELLEGCQPGEFILSRLNAPLVSLTLHLLRNGKRARMAGRDIGQGITTLIRKLKAVDLSDLLSKLDVWERKQTTRYASLGHLALVDRCRDQAEMVRALAEDADSMRELQTKLEWLFVDGEDSTFIRCSSIHKAKGLEAGRVWVLVESLYRRGVTPEEDNLSYVATTRAKSHLTLVTGVPGYNR